MPHQPRRHPPAPHGFSLIELLVVIAIIALLVGLVVMGAAKMRESAEASQTRTMLAGLAGAAADYEVATQLPISHAPSQIFTWNDAKLRNATGATGSAEIRGHGDNADDKQANLYSERFVWAALKHTTTADSVRRVGTGSLVDLDDDGFLELRDAWGKSIAYAAFNTHPTDGFLPESQSPFFASPGADGQWGEPRSRHEFASEPAWQDYLATDGYRLSKDNLYSFDIDRTATATGK